MGVRVRAEGGFSLPEILIVMLLVGVLAAIALPIFLSQEGTSKDASAKSDARNLATAVESCRNEEGSYAACDTRAELGRDAEAYRWGTDAGEVTVASATASSFSIEAVSEGRTGGSHNQFTLRRSSNGNLWRTCTGSGGCHGGSW
jgi:type IV pilus assembly protein PilA